MERVKCVYCGFLSRRDAHGNGCIEVNDESRKTGRYRDPSEPNELPVRVFCSINKRSFMLNTPPHGNGAADK